MRNELAQEIIGLIEGRSQARPTPMEFEMAYQTRVAIDRIRFAIKHTEEFGPHTEQMREAGLQLLDALQRLEAVDRRFQKRSLVTRERNPESNSLPEDNSDTYDTWPSHQPDGQRR